MADNRDKYLKQRRKETDEANKAATKRSETYPTPTQEEVDRAKLGVRDLAELDDKEDDGGEEETRAVVADHPGSYTTREAEAPKKK